MTQDVLERRLAAGEGGVGVPRLGETYQDCAWRLEEPAADPGRGRGAGSGKT